MDGLMVFILMFAVAAAGLMAVFWIASERQLKLKRREVDELITKLEGASSGTALTESSAPQPDHSAELAGLRATNQELQNQIAGLSGKLELSRRTIQELEESQRNTGNSDELQQLQAANERLKGQLSEAQSRLAASEAQLRSSVAGQDAGQSNAQAEAEIAALKGKLEESQTRMRELETAQQNLPKLDEIEAKQREQQRRFEAQIAEMDSELSSHREQLRELDMLRSRLAESERDQQTLREEMRRHEEEIPRWQARIAEAEEHRQRFAALQAPYETLLAKQASLAEKHRDLQADWAAFAQLVAAPAAAAQAMEPSSAPSASSLLGNGMKSESAQEPGAHEEVVPIAQPAPKARRFGIFSALIFFVAAGALASKYLASDSAESTVSKAAMSVQQPNNAVAQPLTASTPSSAAPPAVAPEATAPAQEPPALVVNKTSEAAKAAPLAKPEPRVAGTYEITRSSRVYAAPSEFSQLVGDIEPGVKVNVVNSRDGWLEIHSKHRRPPGFIRKEVAARVVAQN
jgi:hypothetical protein